MDRIKSEDKNSPSDSPEGDSSVARMSYRNLVPPQTWLRKTSPPGLKTIATVCDLQQGLQAFHLERGNQIEQTIASLYLPLH